MLSFKKKKSKDFGNLCLHVLNPVWGRAQEHAFLEASP